MKLIIRVISIIVRIFHKPKTKNLSNPNIPNDNYPMFWIRIEKEFDYN